MLLCRTSSGCITSICTVESVCSTKLVSFLGENNDSIKYSFELEATVTMYSEDDVGFFLTLSPVEGGFE